MTFDSYLRGFKVENWGAGPCLTITRGVRPSTDDNMGCAYWPEEISEEWPGDDLSKRLEELASEVTWTAR